MNPSKVVTPVLRVGNKQNKRFPRFFRPIPEEDTTIIDAMSTCPIISTNDQSPMVEITNSSSENVAI